MIGITSFGTYIPRYRLDRRIIAGNMAWYNPAILAAAKGEKSVANWDEDAITMAVAATSACIAGVDKLDIDGLYLASTSLPFADRLNSDIVSTAVNLDEEGIHCVDSTGSLKAATSSCIAGLDSIAAGKRKSVLVVASDQRRTKMASSQEMFLGDAATALLFGSENVIAEFTGSYSMNCDFIDHYKGYDKNIDYNWEERWVRDEGYGKIIPQAIGAFLEREKKDIGSFDRIVYPCYFAATHRAIGKRLGADPARVHGNMHELCGDTGCAHPLLMLISALEEASAGDDILVAGFGQGCDVLSFRVTENIEGADFEHGVKKALASKVPLDNYQKFTKFRDLIVADLGIRGENSRNTSLTTLWRNRRSLMGLVGARCRKCGTPQFTFTSICVNPACRAAGEMEEYEFSDRQAKVLMYTGDMLAPSVDPPAIYGIVNFDEGGRLLVDFTDCRLDDVEVGLPVSMSFRRRYNDEDRGFSGYFWKGVPASVPGGE